jgi:UDP-GlcNAc:undecaprenyl-phosphate/decaprenyl-phosphate GlcNAc-1-phosphate transferase
MNYFGIVALTTFVITLVLILGALKVFPKLGLLDRPERYGLSRKPIPYYGGVLVFLAVLISSAFFVEWSSGVIGLFLAAGLIVITGFLDDYLRLNPILRLFIQVVAAMLLVVFGIGILSISNPLGGVIDLNTVHVYGVPILGALFTVIWIVVITNTMNFLDGVGGLSSGVSFIASLTIFFLSIRPGIHADVASQEVVAVLALIIAFCALAFLVFDFPPAKILMGDSGSTFFGFMLAALAIFSGGKVATAFLVLGVPILDAGWVILRRIFEGKKPWHGDLKHLHHRLLDLGLEEHKVLYIIYGLATAFGVLAVVCTSTKQKFFVIIALLVLMLLLVAGVVSKARKKL